MIVYLVSVDSDFDVVVKTVIFVMLEWGTPSAGDDKGRLVPVPAKVEMDMGSKDHGDVVVIKEVIELSGDFCLFEAVAFGVFSFARIVERDMQQDEAVGVLLGLLELRDEPRFLLGTQIFFVGIVQSDEGTVAQGEGIVRPPHVVLIIGFSSVPWDFVIADDAQYQLGSLGEGGEVVAILLGVPHTRQITSVNPEKHLRVFVDAGEDFFEDVVSAPVVPHDHKTKSLWVVVKRMDGLECFIVIWKSLGMETQPKNPYDHYHHFPNHCIPLW